MIFRMLDPRTIEIAKQRTRLPGEVGGHVKYADRVVFLLDPDPVTWKSNDPSVSRNVWCFGSDGKLLWKIQDPGLKLIDEDEGTFEYCSFLALYIDDATDELRANTAGANFVIDKDTGRILRYWPKER